MKPSSKTKSSDRGDVSIQEKKWKCSNEPLDFSFNKILDVAQLRKEANRSGRRTKIVESDEEEEAKKVYAVYYFLERN